MKVIFLDIDGVLVTRNFLFRELEHGRTGGDTSGFHLFDPICVDALRKVIDATGAEIVLSSTWKMFGMPIIAKLWSDRKMPGKVFEFTPSKATRGTEIDEWLRTSKSRGIDVDSFVIIDDEVFDLMTTHSERVVKTTFDNGLMDKLADDAIRILNTKIEDKD